MNDPPVFVHEMALSESEEIGPGTRVWAFAHVMAGARVGRDCNICGHAFIEAGAVIGDRVTIKNHVLIWNKVTVEDDAFVGPGAVFTNDVRPRASFKRSPEDFLPTRICRGSTIGANATIVCGVTVGHHAFVGAGSVVTRDVLPHALVAGNPGRQIGWACTCGQSLPSSLACECGRGFARATQGGLVTTVETTGGQAETGTRIASAPPRVAGS